MHSLPSGPLGFIPNVPLASRDRTRNSHALYKANAATTLAACVGPPELAAMRVLRDRWIPEDPIRECVQWMAVLHPERRRLLAELETVRSTLLEAASVGDRGSRTGAIKRAAMSLRRLADQWRAAPFFTGGQSLDKILRDMSDPGHAVSGDWGELIVAIKRLNLAIEWPAAAPTDGVDVRGQLRAIGEALRYATWTPQLQARTFFSSCDRLGSLPLTGSEWLRAGLPWFRSKVFAAETPEQLADAVRWLASVAEKQTFLAELAAIKSEPWHAATAGNRGDGQDIESALQMLAVQLGRYQDLLRGLPEADLIAAALPDPADAVAERRISLLFAIQRMDHAVSSIGTASPCCPSLNCRQAAAEIEQHAVSLVMGRLDRRQKAAAVRALCCSMTQLPVAVEKRWHFQVRCVIAELSEAVDVIGLKSILQRFAAQLRSAPLLA